MASDVTVRLTRRDELSDSAAKRALVACEEMFFEVERICTRFVTTSDLMMMNAEPNEWRVVPEILYRAVQESFTAYKFTDGRFDPRIHDSLVALGYAGTPRFDPSVDVTTGAIPTHPHSTWQLRLEPTTGALNLGGHAIDLGGIGKGLAIRWAGEILSTVADNYLVEAGGDCFCAGSAPDADSWRVSVEDPRSAPQPVAVIEVCDRAVTTSSVRLRRWRANGTTAHHLIDPRTSRPGGEGLLAVTVVGHDAAVAEVWSKALFLAGESNIAKTAHEQNIAALWVDANGTLVINDLMDHYVIWTSS